MTTGSRIATHLLQVHEGGNWTEVSIPEVLEDISLEEARQVTGISPNSIAALIHHISFWNRVVAQRLSGILPEIPADNGFALPALDTEADWAQLKEHNLLSARALARAMEKVPDSDLDRPVLPEHSSVYRNMQGQVEHAHYHLGQIVMIKNELRRRPA